MFTVYSPLPWILYKYMMQQTCSGYKTRFNDFLSLSYNSRAVYPLEWHSITKCNIVINFFLSLLFIHTTSYKIILIFCFDFVKTSLFFLKEVKMNTDIATVAPSTDDQWLGICIITAHSGVRGETRHKHLNLSVSADVWTFF